MEALHEDTRFTPPKVSTIYFKKHFFVLCLMVVPFCAAGAFFLGERATENKRDEIHAQAKSRLQVKVEGDVRTLTTWLEERARTALRITASPVVQMFASDVAASSARVEDEELDAQMPYMRDMIGEFVRQNELIAAYMLTPREDVYLSSANAPSLTPTQRARVGQVIKRRGSYFSPIAKRGDVWVMDMYHPVWPIQPTQGEEDIMAVLVMSMPVAKPLAHLLAPSALDIPSERVALFQREGGRQMLIALHEKDYAAWGGLEGDEGGRLAREKLMAQQSLFVMQEVPQTPFYVARKVRQEIVMAPVAAYRKTVHMVTQLLVLAGGLALLAFWWHMREVREHALLVQYQDFSARINAERRLLSQINNAVKEHITLKNKMGEYTYGNPAFAEFVGHTQSGLVGQNDVILLGQSAAGKMKKLEDDVMATGRSVHVEEKMIIGGKEVYMEVSKSPLMDEVGDVNSLVTVARDVSDVVRERALREKGMKNALKAFMAILAKHDAYLVQHTKMIHRLTAALADHMGLTSDDRLTLDVAAQLCQLGKVFLPLEVLNKPQHTPEEEALYHAHVENTSLILDSLDWGLPVSETVMNMHEHLDGSGYPRGVVAEEISSLSRILGVCVAFCSLVDTAPTFDRHSLTPEEAVVHLTGAPDVYDAQVCTQLALLISKKPEIVLAA